MTESDLKRELLLHADLIEPGEPLTAEQGTWSVHKTVGYVLSSLTERPEHVRAWVCAQMSYCLARAVESLLPKQE